jgi:hypothetical protein
MGKKCGKFNFLFKKSRKNLYNLDTKDNLDLD